MLDPLDRRLAALQLDLLGKISCNTENPEFLNALLRPLDCREVWLRALLFEDSAVICIPANHHPCYEANMSIVSGGASYVLEIDDHIFYVLVKYHLCLK